MAFFLSVCIVSFYSLALPQLTNRFVVASFIIVAGSVVLVAVVVVNRLELVAGEGQLLLLLEGGIPINDVSKSVCARAQARINLLAGFAC